jgi:hypothetical protein
MRENLILGISDICLRLNFSQTLILNENPDFSEYPEIRYPNQLSIISKPTVAGIHLLEESYTL